MWNDRLGRERQSWVKMTRKTTDNGVIESECGGIKKTIRNERLRERYSNNDWWVDLQESQSDWPLDSDSSASLFFRCCCWRWYSMACCWRLWIKAAECSCALRRSSSTLVGVFESKWNSPAAGPEAELPAPLAKPLTDELRSMLFNVENSPGEGKSPGRLSAPIGLGFTGQHGQSPENPAVM